MNAAQQGHHQHLFRQDQGEAPRGNAKRSCDEVKSWFEWNFDFAAYKFRRLNTWTPEAHDGEVQVAAAADVPMDLNN